MAASIKRGLTCAQWRQNEGEQEKEQEKHER